MLNNNLIHGNTLPAIYTKQPHDILKQKELLVIIDAIKNKQDNKLDTIYGFYSNKILAKARFDWIDTNNNKEYKNANLLLVSCVYKCHHLFTCLLNTNVIDLDEYYGENKQTLLMIAAQNSDKYVIQWLLDEGANWRLTDTENNRADQLQLASCKSKEDLKSCNINMCLFLNCAKVTNENIILATGKKVFMVTDNNYVEIKYFNKNNNFIISYFTADVYDYLESEYNNRFEAAVTNDNKLSLYIDKVQYKRNFLSDDFVEYLDDIALEELPENLPEDCLEKSIADFTDSEHLIAKRFHHKDYLLNIFMQRACIEIPLLAKLPNKEAIVELNRLDYYISN